MKKKCFMDCQPYQKLSKIKINFSKKFEFKEKLI